MAVGLLGIIVLLVVGVLVVAAIAISLFLFASRRESGEEGPMAGLLVALGSCGGLAVIGLIVLAGILFLGFFFHSSPAPQMVTAPVQVTTMKPARDEILKMPAADPSPLSLRLSLRAAESAPEGSFVLEILNQMAEPVSPAKLEGRPSAGPWYVEIIGKASSDLVTWNEEDKGKEVGPGGKGAFRVRVPLQDLGAGPEDEIRVYYQGDLGSGETTIRSNKVRVPELRSSRSPAPAKTR